MYIYMYVLLCCFGFYLALHNCPLTVLGIDTRKMCKCLRSQTKKGLKDLQTADSVDLWNNEK